MYTAHYRKLLNATVERERMAFEARSTHKQSDGASNSSESKSSGQSDHRDSRPAPKSSQD